MQNQLQNPTVLAGRVLLGLIFILAGFGKIADFNGTVGYIASGGLPIPSVVAVLTILVEVGGGLLLVFGFFTRPAALVLGAFSVLSAIVFHNFWAVPEAQKMMMTTEFLKNLSIAGGMLVLAAFGPGSISLDAKRNAA